MGKLEISEGAYDRIDTACNEALGLLGVAKKVLPSHIYIALFDRLKGIFSAIREIEIVKDEPDPLGQEYERGDRRYHEAVDRRLAVGDEVL